MAFVDLAAASFVGFFAFVVAGSVLLAVPGGLPEVLVVALAALVGVVVAVYAHRFLNEYEYLPSRGRAGRDRRGR